MAKLVSKSEFKPQALKYFREVEKSGKELIITDRGKPVLKIVPFSPDPAEGLKVLRNTVIKFDHPMDPVGVEDWESLK